MNFFTSDMHFGHARIVELAYRPFSSLEEMNETLVENWNNTVGPTDFVYILGDAVMGKRLETLSWIEKLHGIKHLAPGNHDYCWPHAHFGKPEKTAAKIAEWTTRYEDAGLIILDETICDWGLSDLPDADLLVDICHFPYGGDHTDEERYIEHRPVDRGNVLLHGHVHGLWKSNGRQFNVGCDVWDYTPVREDVLVAYIKEELGL